MVGEGVVACGGLSEAARGKGKKEEETEGRRKKGWVAMKKERRR